MRVTICANCLKTYQNPYGLQIGGEYGSQRDPQVDRIDVCPECAKALHDADFSTIVHRYRAGRDIKVGPGGAIEEEVHP